MKTVGGYTGVKAGGVTKTGGLDRGGYTEGKIVGEGGMMGRVLMAYV